MSKHLPAWLSNHSHRLDSHLMNLLEKQSTYLRYLSTFGEHYPLEADQKLKHVPVLIQHKKSSSFARIQKHLKKMGLIANHYCSHIQTISTPMHPSHIQKILEVPEINKIYLDRKVTSLLDTATPTTGAPQVWSKFKSQGEGVTIAVVDTGIAPHADIASRIIGFQDFVGKKKKPYDDNGHGTHCAGCAAGDGTLSGGLYRGTAPKASLVGVKVLGQDGSGSLSKVIAGIQWCIKNKAIYNIRVISLSLGSVSELSYKDDPICQIVEHAWKNGIVVVSAAGNSGPKSKTISSPGNHPSIITVGATDDRGTINTADDQIAPFSSRGPSLDGIAKPDIVAPGTNIVSLRSPGSYLDQSPDKRVGKNYTSMSGTSMATPIVAGIAALLISLKPSITPNQLKKSLLDGAQSLNLASNVQGSGQVNVGKSLTNSKKRK